MLKPRLRPWQILDGGEPAAEALTLDRRWLENQCRSLMFFQRGDFGNGTDEEFRRAVAKRERFLNFARELFNAGELPETVALFLTLAMLEQNAGAEFDRTLGRDLQDRQDRLAAERGLDLNDDDFLWDDLLAEGDAAAVALNGEWEQTRRRFEADYLRTHGEPELAELHQRDLGELYRLREFGRCAVFGPMPDLPDLLPSGPDRAKPA
jgi:hypothetical protein